MEEIMRPHGQNRQLYLVGIVVSIVILSAGYLWLSSQQQPLNCTINQTPGEVIIVDESMNNAIICTKINNGVGLQLGLWDRVGGVWYISHSPGLNVSDGVVTMFDPHNPGFGTEGWNVTMISPGIQTLRAQCIQGVVGEGHEKLISTQNLTFVVN